MRILSGLGGRTCDMAGCTSSDTQAVSASGIYYLCPPHRELIDEMTEQAQAEDADWADYDVAIAAEEAGAL